MQFPRLKFAGFSRTVKSSVQQIIHLSKAETACLTMPYNNAIKGQSKEKNKKLATKKRKSRKSYICIFCHEFSLIIFNSHFVLICVNSWLNRYFFVFSVPFCGK